MVTVGIVGAAWSRILHRGPRQVLWTPQSGIGFGNLLYAYLYAATRRSQGQDCQVLAAPLMTDWFGVYSKLRELTIERSQVGWRDQRPWVWNSRFGEDFSRSELHQFINAFLVTDQPKADFGDVVVNVRRGEYYDLPHFRGTYSFDIPAYVEIALGRCAEVAPIERIVFVSDGLDWCRLKLDGIASRFSDSVEYYEGTHQASFERVLTTPRIVGTNSSFTYWAGYIGGVIHDQSHVVMPRFHARLGNDWSAYQLDPTWDIVEDIPGGWNA